MNSAEGPDISGAHCRICGSAKLNKYHFAIELAEKITPYQILTRDTSIDQLIRPCECRGDFAYAHSVCLSDWIETTKHERCDICRFRYIVHFFERSFFDWISELEQIETLIKTSTVALLVYYVSFLGLIAHWDARNLSVLSDIVKVSAYVWIAGCTLYLIVAAFNLHNQYNCWRQANRRVVVEPNKNPQLDSGPRPKDVLKSSGFKFKSN